MLVSAAWINAYLDPPADAEEQAELLTRAGFPRDAHEEIVVAGRPDVRQEIETTSNRGDCLCHLGLAREIAAMSGRRVVAPEVDPPAAGPDAGTIVRVENRDHGACPLYTARVIRGVKIGPSPAWLRERLEARGEIPRNNIVDATNFVLYELGQPTHVFDLALLRGPAIVVRRARDGERFVPLGEGAAAVTLVSDDLVIADAERPVALAGVKGGAETAVTESTVDILLEAATFAPGAVRAASRRHGIASDSSYRFERGVHPGQVDHAADRLAALILEVAGGTLCAGTVRDGAPIPPPRHVSLRPERCRALLGVDVPDDFMMDALDRLGFGPRREGERIACIVPPARLDVEREIDLVEEIGRRWGYDKVPILDAIRVQTHAPQPTEAARRAVAEALVGMAFVETLTHSLVSERAARAFLPPGLDLLRVNDERAGAEPVLRPAILPSLLRVARHNADHGVRRVRLFEGAATFALREGAHLERSNLALLHDADDDPNPLRETRGILERLARIVLGERTELVAEPLDGLPWLAPGAAVRLGGEVLGTLGLIAPAVARIFELDRTFCAAEIGLPAHYHRYPPVTQAEPLPAFPAVERDLSVILPEGERWQRVADAIAGLGVPDLETVEFVTTWRGAAIGAGRKSVTLRLRFRAADRTLTHDAVDAAVGPIVSLVETTLGGEIRR